MAKRAATKPPKPARALALARQAGLKDKQTVAEARDFARHILLFDSDDETTFSPHSLPRAAIMTAAARAPIPWPSGKAPQPKPITPKPRPASPLPRCDYLLVTWTVEEAKCLADILTPGYASKTDWYPYTHKFASEYASLIRHGAPAAQSKRLGSYFLTMIGGKRVLCFKSELHMSQDGARLPVAKLWSQLIAEVQPKLLITTGTAGGIGAAIELGDVVVAPNVQFDCTKEFKNSSFHDAKYACSRLRTSNLAIAQRLIAANVDHLPQSDRAPKIFARPTGAVQNLDVVTTDFFAYDDTADTFGLQPLGSAVEMGDAVLGMVIAQMQAAGQTAPRWSAVRNASDPQMDVTGLTPEAVRAKAGQIYERYGYWTTISSALACWALVLDN